MHSENHITGSCSINNGIVIKDGVELFKNQATTLPAFLLSVYQYFKLSYPKFYKMDNLSKLGWLASEILLNDNFKPHIYRPEQVGVVLANANSSLDDDIKYYQSVKDIPSPSLFVYTLPNIMIGEICIRNNFKGEHALFVADHFDAGFMERQVNYLLDKNLLEACICGWADVLGEEYKAVLFLVEKKKDEHSLLFCQSSMDNIFLKS